MWQCGKRYLLSRLSVAAWSTSLSPGKPVGQGESGGWAINGQAGRQAGRRMQTKGQVPHLGNDSLATLQLPAPFPT
jgi:hypothetical protein